MPVVTHTVSLWERARAAPCELITIGVVWRDGAIVVEIVQHRVLPGKRPAAHAHRDVAAARLRIDGIRQWWEALIAVTIAIVAAARDQQLGQGNDEHRGTNGIHGEPPRSSLCRDGPSAICARKWTPGAHVETG
jgi:hypothetical protein